MDVEQQFDAVFGENPEQLQAEVDSFEAEAARKAEEGDAVAEIPEEAKAAPVEEAPEPEKAKGDQHVPLAVFLEQKNELRDLRREMAELRNQMQPRQEPQQQAPVGPPKFQPTVSKEEDPATWLEQRTDYLEQMLAWQGGAVAQTAQVTHQQQQAAQQQQAIVQLTNAVTTGEEQFRAAMPDYDDAVEYFHNSRAAEVVALAGSMGQQITKQQAMQAVTQEIMGLAANALRAGVNPAAALYELTKARGYTPKQTAAAVERIQRGVAASRSSQAVPGSQAAPSGEASSGDFFKDMQRQAGYRK